MASVPTPSTYGIASLVIDLRYNYRLHRRSIPRSNQSLSGLRGAPGQRFGLCSKSSFDASLNFSRSAIFSVGIKFTADFEYLSGRVACRTRSYSVAIQGISPVPEFDPRRAITLREFIRQKSMFFSSPLETHRVHHIKRMLVKASSVRPQNDVRSNL